MTRRAAIGSRAKRDVANAIEWYEKQRPGLGREFKQAVEESIELLRRIPELGKVVHGGIRRLPVQRFPYTIYYRVMRYSIRVRACLHDRRDARVRETPQVSTVAGKLGADLDPGTQKSILKQGGLQHENPHHR